MSNLRLLGLGFRWELPLLLKALERWNTVVGTVKPTLAHPTIPILVRYIHPDRQMWRARADMSPAMYQQRSRSVEKQLQPWKGKYDVIVQWFAFFTPGIHPERQCYVVTTDYTIEISARLYPSWSPFRGRARQEQRQWEERIYRNAAFVFPYSDFVRTSLIEDYGCDPQRVITVNPGTRIVARSIANKRYDRQVALFIGYAFERKGGPELLRAWSMVHRQLPDAQLWIVGPRKPQAPPQPGVHWLGRIGQRERVQELMEQATVFVLPSRVEPWGMVLTEAMGSALACITSNLPTLQEVVQHGTTGLLIEPGQPDSIAEALIELLGNPEQAAAMGKAAYRYVLLHRTWAHAGARISPYLERAARGEV